MPLCKDAVEHAASLLAEARLAASALPELPESCRPESLVDAYAVQMALHRNLAKAGWGQIAGHKIGCTTTVMQQYLNIEEPCAGGIFAKTITFEEGHYARSALCRPGVECEIAVRLSADLPGQSGGYTHATIEDAVGAVMASIELVDDRWDDFTALPMASLLADDFFGAGCVLGAEMTNWRNLDLATLCGRMLINGNQVGEGMGGDILGHPLNALVWLADLRAKQSMPLKAGEIVTLGSLVKTVWVDKGDEIVADIDGLRRTVLVID